MTISIAIRTASAMVFATDSRMTEQVIGGDASPATPKVITDGASKLGLDDTKKLMAMVCGDPKAGDQDILQAVASFSFPDATTEQEQDGAIRELASGLYDSHVEFWKDKVQKSERRLWPHGSIILFGIENPKNNGLRILRADLYCDPMTFEEVEEDVFLEGSYDHVYPRVFKSDDAFTELFSERLASAEKDNEALVALAAALVHKQIEMEQEI